MSKEQNTVILFWSNYDPEIHTDFEKWINSEVIVSPLHYLSLKSHLKQDNKVFLYTYQSRIKERFFDGIEIKDASEFLDPIKAFKSLQMGHSIAHVSDAIRLKASAKHNGIVLDMDGVCLNPFPSVDGFFSSCPAKQTGGMAQKWGKNNPALIVNDGSWDGKALSMFPVKPSNLLRNKFIEIADNIVSKLKKEPKGNWNFVMWALKPLANYDKTSKVYPPLINCPLPGWCGKGKCYSLESPTRLDGKTQLFGYTLPTIDDILNNSVIVQHFYESAFHKANISDSNFWINLTDGCLLSKEAEKIMGADWRAELDSLVKNKK